MNRCVLVFILFAEILIVFSQTPAPTNNTSATPITDCTLNKSSDTEKKLLEALKNKKFTTKQFKFNDDEHYYSFGLCTKAQDANKTNEGMVQKNIKTNFTYIIGRLDDVDLEGTDQYIRLTYKKGDAYKNTCGKAERNAVVIIMCNTKNDSETFRMIEENHERDNDDCGYVFELLTPLMCDENVQKMKSCMASSTSTPIPATAAPTTSPATATSTSKVPATTNASSTSSSSKQMNSTTSIPMNASTTSSASKSSTSSKLGFFSIAMIIILGLLFSYFVIGTLYNRFVHQTRGIEQLPHWQLWHTLGLKLQECGLFVCRCGKKPTEIRSYEHINDQLSDDENLLNM